MQSIIEIVGRRNKDGSYVDLDQIIERIDYQVSKQAIQFTLRGMIQRGVIEKCGIETRRGRNRILYRTTALGQDYFKALYVYTPSAEKLD